MITDFKNSIRDFILYSHLFIALCAVSISLLTSLIYLGELIWSIELIFIFMGTLGLYGIHRLFGLQKAHDHLGQNRYHHIKSYHRIILIIVIVSLPVAGYLFLQFDHDLQYFLIIPIILSLAYVLPTWKKRRLRDVAYVKIFIISLVWAFVTAGIPLWDHFANMSVVTRCAIVGERFVFILAITLPFDIRDMEIDQYLKVKTIPRQLGIQKSKQLSFVLLGLCAVLMILLGKSIKISIWHLAGYLFGLLITSYIVLKVTRYKSDYYFSGWVDGTMIILWITTLLGHWLGMSLL